MSKVRKKMPGTVRKVIKPVGPEPEKAQCTKVRTFTKKFGSRTKLTDEKGEMAKLKEGGNVDVVVEADSDATQKAE